MLIDQFKREIDYLRVSVTEKCNFRCSYCMPNTPLDWEPKENLLSIDELFNVIKVSIDNGIKKIRITGGEPLIRKDLDILIKKIYDYKEDVEINLTTNGFFLKDQANRLKSAGLKRVNISLDTLDEEVFFKIAKIRGLEEVLDGIEKSLNVGLKVKINMVPLKGVNENEIIALLDYCRGKNIPLRYIEYMANAHAMKDAEGLKKEEILEVIKKSYSFTEREKNFFGPATLYRMDNDYVFGIISPHDDDFCKSCNRLRLTAEGNFIPCLFYDDSLNIKKSAGENNQAEMEKILKKAVEVKPEKNLWGTEESERAFYKTGG